MTSCRLPPPPPPLLLLLLFFVGAVSVTPCWYHGCFSFEDWSKEFVWQNTSVGDLVGCARQCFFDNYNFVAVDGFQECACLNETENWTEVESSLCDNHLPILSLPSGGNQTFSVYKTEGPYFVNSKIFIDADWIVVNNYVVLEAEVKLARLVNITDELGKQEWTNTVDFLWTVDQKEYKENITAERNFVRCRIPHTFLESGIHYINVTIRNALSAVTENTSVIAILPEPRDLQVSLVEQPKRQPSCVPYAANKSSEEIVMAVFKNVSEIFEASVSVGVNLMFTWLFSDTESVFTHIPSEGNPSCQDNCTSVLQDYTFTELGTYKLTVTASNNYGSISRNLTVVVDDQDLGNMSLSIPESSRFSMPHSDIWFVVTLDVTSRQDTTIQIDYGDGNIENIKLASKNSSYFNDCSSSLLLIKDYGDGCLLTGEICHIYHHQGKYEPYVIAKNNVSEVMAKLEDKIIIQNELQLARIRVDSIHQPTIFTFDLAITSETLTITWIIMFKNLIILNVTTTSQQLVHNFTTAGHYQVAGIAQNLVSSVSSSNVSFYVVEPVQGLELQCKGDTLLKTGDFLNCSAEVQQGTQVVFNWWFGNYSYKHHGNLFSVVVHSFHFSGKYNVSVTASNEVSNATKFFSKLIDVQQPIAGLQLKADEAASLDRLVCFSAQAELGSDLKFDWDFGEGKRYYNGVETEGQFSVNYNFTKLGFHNVTVYAYNDISMSTDSVEILIEEPPKNIDVEIIRPTIHHIPILFLVKTKVPFSYFQNITYEWSFSTGKKMITATPIISKKFTSPGMMSVNVTARNKVDSISLRKDFRVTGRSEVMWVRHPVVVEAGEDVKFELLNSIPSIQYLKVNYSDGNLDHVRQSYFSWNRTFLDPGLFVIDVAAFVNDSEVESVQTYISVQKIITDLVVYGDNYVSVNRDYTWEAVYRGGTAVLFQWSIENETYALAHYPKFTYKFNQSGEYLLSVLAENDVSTQGTSFPVLAQFSIVEFEVDTPPSIQGHLTNIYLTVRGGRSFFVEIDFKDGNITVLSSEDPFMKLETLSRMGGFIPVYRINFTHLYSTPGTYILQLNVSNHVSSVSKQQAIIVEEAIIGIRLKTDSPSTISLDDEVTVIAYVDTGRNLSFEWDFSDGYKVMHTVNGNNSTAKHTFKMQGEYEVKVYVSNPLSSQPMVGTLPFKFLVVDKIKFVRIVSENNKRYGVYGAALRDSTKEITFNAQSDGSHVTFVFDYGDGFTERVLGKDVYVGIAGTGKHIYTKEGVYQVSVTSENPLSNATAFLPAPFYVQIPPRGLSLPRNFYTQFHDVTRFYTTIVEGTNVTYHWRFDDQKEVVRAGPNVTHTYTEAGDKFLMVTAKNYVDEESAEAFVYVRHEIQGVVLECSKSVLATNEEFELKAFVTPDLPYTFDWFVWDLGTQIKSLHMTSESSSVHSFRKTGRYIITVKAFNKIKEKHAVSEPLELYVIEKVGSLQIEYKYPMLFNQPIKFRTYHYSGAHLNYTWDFGDGSLLLTVKKNTVYHTYTRIGKYKVTLFAANLISNATVSDDVFILDFFCSPPKIQIMGMRVQKIERSREVRIESMVSVDCSNTSSLFYIWKIQNGSSEEEVLLPNIKDQVFHERVLFLPRWTLPYGNYTVHLQVQIDKLIVYSTAEISVLIVPTPLRCIISGGIIRDISRNSTVLLDGINSYDPDLTQKLRYKWTCYTLRTIGPCFQNSTENLLLKNESKLQFPARWFVKDRSAFVFNLTLSAPGRNTEVATQVIHVTESKEVLHALVYCRSCVDDIMNANQKLVLQAECDESEVSYTWKLYLINDGNDYDDLVYRVHDGRCVKPDGSSYHFYVNNVTNTTPSLPEATIKSTLEPTKHLTTSGRKDFLFPHPFGTHFSMMPGFGSLSESKGKPRGKRSRSRFTNNRTERIRASYSLSTTSYEWKISQGMHPMGSRGNIRSPDQRYPKPKDVLNGKISEGKPRDRFRTKIVKPQIAVRTTKKPDQLVFDETVEINEHIVGKPRSQILLLHDHTTTGLASESLVIKPGFLMQGRHYFIKVEVEKKGNADIKGAATAHFYINPSPTRGDCTILPDAGKEMLTNFCVFCKEWQDEQQPLTYEVSYNFEKAGRKNLIYRGLKESVNFQLPAGNAENNHEVFVYIAIMDNLGARTSVCFIPIRVQPANQSLEVIEKNLYDEATFKDNSLAKYLDKGDDRNTRIVVSFLAIRLNRLPPRNDSEPQAFLEKSENLRLGTRKALLRILKGLPVRDELEILQTIQALVQTTLKTKELDLESVKLALSILESILQSSQNLYNVTGHQTEDLLQLVIDSASNIIEATASSSDSDTSLVKKSSDTVSGFLQNELKLNVVGEKPIQHICNFIGVYAAMYNFHEKPTLEIGGATFKLPEDMSRVLPPIKHINHYGPMKIGRGNKCYQAQMSSFKKNPFVMGSLETNKVLSQVPSLKLFGCDGKMVNVTHLTEENLITIGIPLEITLDETSGNYTLHRKYMNIHQFNVSQINLNQSFHILVNLTPVYSGHLFPIIIFISDQHPSMQHTHLKQKEFNSNENELKIFLPAGTLKKTGIFYLGIVDSTYNAGRPRPGIVTKRDYSLKMWWGQCLFWNETNSQWSGKGCWATHQSTHHWTQCRCNHLTSFGSHFKLIASDLIIVDIETFFDMNKNPIPIILLAVLLCTYACLLVICCRADIRDMKKGCVVFLQDNIASDRQKYEIIVETGFRKGAGTTAKISIILHGEEGMSETRELISEDGRSLFERNSRDKFIMTLPDSIGKMWKVQLWHDNFGSSPSWYLSKVIVKDLNTGNSYYFVCEKWFAVEEEDGKIEREVLSLDGNLRFGKVLWSKGTQYLADFHLWMSLFTRPAYSRFTRAQRLTCCFTLLVSYMCLNAVWYQKSKVEYHGEFGLLDISWQSVLVGAMCCIVAIPVNLFLAFLFRRSSIQHPEIDDDKNYEDGKSEDSESTRGESVQPIMTYSILDQSILNWQSIQEWAHKQWYKQQLHNAPDSPKPDTPSPAPNDDKKGDETDVVSSGFEDSNSQDRTQLSGEAGLKSKLQSSSHLGNEVKEGCKRTDSNQSKSENKPKKVNNSFFLPHWCRWLAWTLCVLISLACQTVMAMCAFRFGKIKCVMWLQSLYFSFLFCVFLSHPLMILVASLYTAIRHRNNPAIFDHHGDDYYGEKQNTDAQKKKQRVVECCEECEELERGVAARQRSRYLRFARPPQEKQLIEARKKTMKEKKTISFVRDTAVLSLFLFLLCVMAFGKNTKSPFLLNEALKNTFFRSGNKTFNSIRDVGDWWDWIQTSFLQQVYWESWYNGKPVEKINYIADGSSYLIGKVHIYKFQASDEEACLVGKYKHLAKLCHPSTILPPHQAKRNVSHQSVKVEQNKIVQLPSTRSAAYIVLTKLDHQNWIDKMIRTVVVEFTLYNPPTNLFSSVSLSVKLPVTGGAFPKSQISSTYLFRYVSRWDHFILICELLFIVVVMCSTKNILADITVKRKLFDCLWKDLDVLITIISALHIICYIYRFVLVSDVVEHFRGTFYQEFVDISFVTLWDEVLKTQVGFILFLALCKMLSLSRYKKLFTMFGNIYRKAHKEIFIFAALFIILFMVYTSVGYLAFGALSASFCNFWSGIGTMTALLTRSYSFEEFNPYFQIGGKLFITSYLIAVTGLLTSYMVAILTHQYGAHKQGKILAMNGKDALKFIWGKLLHCVRMKKSPALESPETTLPAEFTLAEIEYQVDELLFRMNALSGLSSLPEKPPCYFTDSDTTCGGVGDDGISSGGSEVHPDDEDRLGHRLQKIEDNLYSQEPYLAQLIKLHSIGADILSEEKEKQLRSHLELEIFRQLQLQRQDDKSSGQSTGSQSNDSSNQTCTSAVERSPSTASTSSHKQQPDTPKLAEIEKTISVIQPQNNTALSTQMNLVVASSDANLSPMKSGIGAKPKNVASMRETGKNHHRGNKITSGSNSSKNAKKTELPPKPTYAQSILKDLPPIEITGPNMLTSPTLRRPADVVKRRENQLMESSSGSEQDGMYLGRRPPGKRNLRKTKSRGKGKGSGNLAAAFLFDDECLENWGGNTDNGLLENTPELADDVFEERSCHRPKEPTIPECP